MIQKIKTKIEEFKKKREQKQQLFKAKKYYKLLREGAVFLQYIYKDLEKMKKDNYNRQQRRRWEKQLKEKGTFSEELINYYAQKIDLILVQVEQQLNPIKKKEN